MFLIVKYAVHAWTNAELILEGTGLSCLLLHECLHKPQTSYDTGIKCHQRVSQNVCGRRRELAGNTNDKAGANFGIYSNSATQSRASTPLKAIPNQTHKSTRYEVLLGKTLSMLKHEGYIINIHGFFFYRSWRIYFV